MEGNKKSKTAAVIFLTVIIAAAALWLAFFKNPSPDGSTLESREKLISGLDDGKDWMIDKELVIGDHIISSAYSSGNKASLVTFKAEGKDGYSVQSSVKRNKDEIITDTVDIDGKGYVLITFMGAETEYAMVTCTDNVSGEESTVKYDAEVSDIIYFESPSHDFTMNVVYYDAEGNVYE